MSQLILINSKNRKPVDMFQPTDSEKNTVDIFPPTDDSKDIHSILSRHVESVVLLQYRGL